MPGTDTGSGGANGQAPDATQGQAPTTDSGQAPGAQNGQAPGAADGSGTDAALQAQLRAAERERDEARREAAKLRNDTRQREQQGMSELERANARVAELERLDAERTVREQDRSIRLAAVEEATRVGFRSPDLAYRLIDRAEVDFTEAGEPRNVARLLKVIADRDPYLLKGNGADFGGGNRGAAPSTTDMNALIRRAAGHS